GGSTNCSGTCVDTKNDPKNCGGCGTTCPTGSCVSSVCTLFCEGGTTACGGSCVNLSNDASHCGTCVKACGATEICASGACGCTTGLTDCSGTCVNTSTDPAHCGACTGATSTCSGG